MARPKVINDHFGRFLDPNLCGKIQRNIVFAGSNNFEESHFHSDQKEVVIFRVQPIDVVIDLLKRRKKRFMVSKLRSSSSWILKMKKKKTNLPFERPDHGSLRKGDLWWTVEKWWAYPCLHWNCWHETVVQLIPSNCCSILEKKWIVGLICLWRWSVIRSYHER